ERGRGRSSLSEYYESGGKVKDQRKKGFQDLSPFPLLLFPPFIQEESGEWVRSLVWLTAAHPRDK
ncbi:MAG TPA: hypothetical protein DCY91_04685, partial [Cyanobacteria bacterium UBA11370]|nr:hypothetical protein [Cyanobacteria bacterium UBA11370]